MLRAMLAPVIGEDELSIKSFKGHLDREAIVFDPLKTNPEGSLI